MSETLGETSFVLVQDFPTMMATWEHQHSLRSPSFYVFKGGYRMYIRVFPSRQGGNVYLHTGLTQGRWATDSLIAFKQRRSQDFAWGGNRQRAHGLQSSEGSASHLKRSPTSKYKKQLHEFRSLFLEKGSKFIF